ncbi:hypothetical protein [Salinivibrio socompensis]|uniref:hypothetical protein n=1 Tax=Salinivibrio socompensis TaxID=1510206 RepID=UPI0004B058A4|nr:hypothetical protein [Salinivibrio socompensis]
MTHSSPSLTDTKRARRLKDKLTRQTVRLGGVMVFVTLLLLFFYLLTVVIPLFYQASVTVSERFSISSPGTPRFIGTDNRNQLVYGLDETGVLTVARRPSQSSAPKEAALSAQAKTVLQRSLSSISRPAMSWAQGTAPVVAVERVPGQIDVWQLSFRNHYQDSHTVIPQLSPMSAFGGSVTMDPEGQSLDKLALAIPDSLHGQPTAPVLVAATADNQLVIYRGRHRASLPLNAPVSELALSADGQRLFVRQHHILSVWQLTNEESVKRERLNLSNVNASPVITMRLLAGGRSLMLQHQNGDLTQWFDVIKSGEPSLTKVRTFSPGTGAKIMAPELHRKSLATVDNTGQLSLIHVTSEKQRHFDRRFTSVPDVLAFAPRANALIAVTQHQWQWLAVDNPHPEVSIHSLWQKVWYEGYSSPQYVWQSTSADDSAEAKLSVVPVIFGTLKVAVVALLFAVPMAIGAAIYTAYFMSSG